MSRLSRLLGKLGGRRRRVPAPPAPPPWLRTSDCSVEELARMRVPVSAIPVASIVIPTFGRADLTRRCLASIAAQAPRDPIEVIVVDDASPDPETGALAAVGWIRLLRLERNLGFVGASNAGARLAQGELVCFLNNDTEAAPGWLDAMIDTLDRHADVGVVGAKLLFPDGRLQEAGAVVFKDGNAWNFGRGDDPDLPAYNYLREVDYCSGACLLVRRSVLGALGGFDAFFSPAYYEDVDLAFRARAAGWKTVYQPTAVVAHHEGASHGADEGCGVKAFQAVNRTKFRERWRETLEAAQAPPGRPGLRARDRALDRPIVLVVDHHAPEPDRDAGSNCVTALIEALAAGGACVKLWPINERRDHRYASALRQAGVEVLGGDIRNFRKWIAAHARELAAAIVSRPTVADVFLRPLRAAGVRTIYLGHDIHADRLRMEAELTGARPVARLARQMLRLERRIWRLADLTLYFSDEEAARVRALEPRARSQVLTPYAFEDFARRRAPPAGQELLFVAGFAHPPNEDAAIWLVSTILPLVLRAAPRARLCLAGAAPTEPVRRLAGPGVAVTGALSAAELDARYGAARAAVAPLRVGAGVKLKVVEALRHGLPLVTTPVGAQGLEGLSEVAAVCADPEGLAAEIVRLLTDDELWLCRSRRQSAYAETRFSRGAHRTSLDAALAAVGVTLPIASPY